MYASFSQELRSFQRFLVATPMSCLIIKNHRISQSIATNLLQRFLYGNLYASRQKVERPNPQSGMQSIAKTFATKAAAMRWVVKMEDSSAAVSKLTVAWVTETTKRERPGFYQGSGRPLRYSLIWRNGEDPPGDRLGAYGL